MPSWKRHLGTFSMNYSNTIDYDSLTLIDYIDELPSSNQTKYYPKKKYNEDGSYVEIPLYLTRCVSPSHNDRHPSMVLYEGDTRIVFHCYSCGNREAINNYFHQRFIKRFSAASGLDEQKAIEEINKGANHDPNN